MKKLTIIILTLIFLTGCYNYTELNDLAVASSILITKDEDKYKVSVETYDEKEVKVYNGKGKTLTEAIENANKKSDKTFYYHHLNAVLITKDVDIEDVIYYFFRNPNTNNNFALIYSDKDDIYTDEEVNIGSLIKNTLSKTETYSFFGIVKSFINKTKDISLPIFDGKDLQGVKTFNGTKISGEITEKDDNILRILLNKTNSYLDTACGDEHFVIDIECVKTDYQIEDKIKVNVKLESSIRELTCDLDTSKVKDLKKIEDLAAKNLEKKINNLLEKLKEENTDLIGLNTKINNKTHSLNKDFKDYDYEVKVDVSIYKKGLLLK